MINSINKQIFFRALISSPIIALLLVTPLYIINEYSVLPFFRIWTKTLFGVLAFWIIQAIIFNYFKKKNYQNWTIGIIILGVMLVIVLSTVSLSPNFTPGLMDYPKETLLTFRFAINCSANLFIFLLMDLIYSREDKLKLALDNSILKYDNLDNKYKLLKAQINPHFLFNALNVSKSLVKTKPDEAEKYIVGLSKFLRNSLNNQQKSVSLKNELKYSQQYIDLQNVRFEDTIEFYLNIDEIEMEKQIPYFTLITLIENAIKHNAFSKENPLKIYGSVVDNSIFIKNKITPKNGVVSNHVGLSNLNERSQMLSGEAIQIENDGEYFTVKVKLMQ